MPTQRGDGLGSEDGTQRGADALVSMTPVLSVQALKTSFKGAEGWLPVVHDVSFDVAANETVAIVGESGSGKSVTAMSIMRLLRKGQSRIEGRIALQGRDLLPLTEAQMRSVRGDEIGMIFQEPMTSLNPVLTVGLQISEALRTHRSLSRSAAEAEAVRLLDRVRIPDSKSRAGQHPHMMSGGMRQRVMIAMALACSPKLLIADEPTTALDVTIQSQILDLIRALQAEEHMAVLFITHDMGVVAEIADRTIVMNKGRIVEAGSTRDIFRHPRVAYTQTLLAAIPKLGSMAGEALPKRFAAAAPAAPGATPAADTRQTACPPILKVENLQVRYPIRAGLMQSVIGQVHAVESVSFTMQPGETLSVVGESGCGKSTTGRAIVGLVKPTGGAIALGATEPDEAGAPAEEGLARRIQMIFQDPFASLNPRKTIGEAIGRPMRIHGLAANLRQAEDKAADMLQRVGMSADMIWRYPHEFSGGQRQRICIARALCLGPKILVADEAVSALDVSIKAQVVDLMLDLQHSLGLSYLFISHDMAVVERVSHRVAVMYLGEIVEIGPRSAIFENPRHAYTKRLLSAVPVADPELRGTRASPADEEIKSPIRPLGYEPVRRRYEQVGEGHLVLCD
jgi:peptide/nickel transport system ATP-binding protein